MESLYWVFTLKCNDLCNHCYNNSGPRGESVSTEELLKIIPHLPTHLKRIILSGGEPTVEMPKLIRLVRALRERYGESLPIYIQSNGDLMNDEKLSQMLEAGIDRIDIVSMDRYHKQQGAHRERLETLLQKHGMVDASAPQIGATPTKGKEYAFWGATEELWLQGNWARGRALKTGLAKRDPKHNFCGMWSGALGFLDTGSTQQEVHIQLYRLYPCCPTTYYALGDVRNESVESILDRYRHSTDFQQLNRGEIYQLGESADLKPDFIQKRIEALGDVCLWCDEYFEKYYSGPKGEARRQDPNQSLVEKKLDSAQTSF